MTPGRPLEGRRVAVTRPRTQQDRLRALLEARGASVLDFPVIRIDPPPSWEPLDAALAELDTYHWLVFTSRNGVDAFFDRLEHAGRDARSLGGRKVAAIGPATAAALRARGVRPDLVPDEHTSDGLLRAFKACRWCRGMRVLHPRAAAAPPDLPRGLEALGLTVRVVPAYVTVRDGAGAAATLEALRSGAVHAVTFTSASTVEHALGALAEAAGDPGGAREALGRAACVAIGPVTAAALRRAGLEPARVAAAATLEGLVAAVEEALGVPGPPAAGGPA